jgi:hypothetical protein
LVLKKDKNVIWDNMDECRGHCVSEISHAQKSKCYMVLPIREVSKTKVTLLEVEITLMFTTGWRLKKEQGNEELLAKVSKSQLYKGTSFEI